MNATTIHQLSGYLRDRGVRPVDETDLSAVLGIRDTEVAQFCAAYREVDYGFKALKEMAARRIDFPAFLRGDDSVLFKAYCYMRDPKKYRSDDMTWVLAMCTSGLRHARSVLKGLLLSADCTIAQAATIIGINTSAVALFEKLFFNVKDREKDSLYLSQVVYPDGRLDELLGDYLGRVEFDTLVKRSGYNNGKRDVMHIAGFRLSTTAVLGVQETLPSMMEHALMAQGVIYARNGFFNQSLPVISSARQLLTAGKIGGAENNVDPFAQAMGQSLTSQSKILRARRTEMLNKKAQEVLEVPDSEAVVAAGGRAAFVAQQVLNAPVWRAPEKN